MKDLRFRRAAAILVSAATVFSFALPAIADGGTKEVSLHLAAYYNDAKTLLGVKEIRGSLSKDEVDALVDIYEPENADKAKVFEWTDNIEPTTENSGREVDISDEPEVVILHTNDMHGALVGSSSVIGSDSVAALKKLDNAILADAGDASQGVALASQSKGESVIKIMNAAGYDVMAAGNHEFDYGLGHFKELRDMANFPIISANTYKGDALLCADGDNNGANVIIDKNGVKVGIFALTTQNTRTSTKPENVAGVEFKDEIETAKEQVADLESKNADVIIALTHMGDTDEGECTSLELAEALKDTELDAIIDGHTHHVVNKKVGNITIAQTGTGSVNVGRMAINIEENGEVTIDETMLSRAFFNNITPDAEVTKTITDASSELDKTLKQKIGETKTTLWGGSIRGVITEGRVGETNFGSLICDAMIEEAKNLVPDKYKDAEGNITAPIVAIENGGGYRASIPNGQITLGHIIDALPFANNVRIMEITPKQLYSALEGYISSEKNGTPIGVTAQDDETGFLTATYEGSFPQIGGMRICYDPNKPVGEKIEVISLIAGNTDLDKNDDTTELILASHDYIIGAEDMIAEGSGLTETVTAYINSMTEGGTKPLEFPVTLGRIITTAHNPDNYTYTAHITLTNASSLAADSEVPVYVDGEAYDKAAVVKDEEIKIPGKDENGNEIVKEMLNVRTLNIELPDGPHAIKLFPEQEEVYVNNYSGNGILYTYNGLTLKYPELEYDAEKIEQPAG